MFKSAIDDAQEFMNKFDTSKLGDDSSGIDVDSIVAAVTKFPTGTCFMIDRLNRNGIIRIVSIYDTKLLTSNPFEKSDIKQKE